jgi:hypothetical protein
VKQQIHLKHINKALNIGLVNWKEVYLLEPEALQLHPEVHKGRLTYRARGSSRRYSYTTIKEGLVKKSLRLTISVPF